MIPCPRCSAENDDEARFCDQCGTGLSEEEAGAPLELSCPACGGEVREVPSVVAVCRGCGLRLGENAAEAAPACGSCGPSPAPAQAEAEAAGPEQPAEREPCPVCGAQNPAGAGLCAGCGIAFRKLTRPIECPRCSAECMDDKCSCGTVLTLSALVEYLDGSVRRVCPACKQLFSTDRKECSDCGAELKPADGLREYADSR